MTNLVRHAGASRQRNNRAVLEELRGLVFPVREGFVYLDDAMGDDRAIVEAARVSYGRDGVVEMEHVCAACGMVAATLEDALAANTPDDHTTFVCVAGPGGATRRHVWHLQTTASQQAEDATLLRYLMRHRHGTPFEMAEVKLVVQCPIDVMRQWIRHRTANVNEYSTRYTTAIDTMAVAPSWRMQAASNKQGSAGAVADAWPAGYHVLPINEDGAPLPMPVEDAATVRDWGVFCVTTDFPEGELRAVFLDTTYAAVTPAAYLSQREEQTQHSAQATYQERLAYNVAREQARKDLPMSTHTRVYWKCDVRNILHFLSLRMDSHAQEEIREFATVIGAQIIAKLFPETWAAFLDYDFNAMQFTACDQNALKFMLAWTQLPLRLHTTNTAEGFGAWFVGRVAADRAMASLLDVPSSWVAPRCRERDEFFDKLQVLKLVTN